MPAQRCLLHKRRPKAAGAATMRGLPERRSKYFRLAMRRGRKIAKVACGTAERSMQRNSDFSPTHAARYRTSLKRTQLFLEKLVQRLFSSAPVPTTAVLPSPDCLPLSETFASSPDRSYPLPSAATLAFFAPSTSDSDSAHRWLAPCCCPSQTVAPLVAPPRSRRPTPPPLNRGLSRGSFPRPRFPMQFLARRAPAALSMRAGGKHWPGLLLLWFREKLHLLGDRSRNSLYRLIRTEILASVKAIFHQLAKDPAGPRFPAHQVVLPLACPMEPAGDSWRPSCDPLSRSVSSSNK